MRTRFSSVHSKGISLFDSFVSLDVEPVLGTGGEGSGTEGTLEGFVSSVDPERNRIKLRHKIEHFKHVT